jgi:hypothetical protein
MSDEIEYIEPTQEHVGQIVEVRDSDNRDWRKRKLIGIIRHQLRFVVEPEEYGLPLPYKYARIPRPQPQPAEPPTKPIDWTKPVRTKDGRAVQVLCTDGPGDYPVAGYVDGLTNPRSWTLNGYHHVNKRHSTFDLENAPQRIQREYWVNVYATCLGSSHDTKEDADYHATGQRLACVKITIDCEEGEGL